MTLGLPAGLSGGFSPPGTSAVVALVAVLAILVMLVGVYHVLVPRLADQRLSEFVGAKQVVSPAIAGLTAAGGSSLLASFDRQMIRRGQSADIRLLLQRGAVPMSVAELLLLRVVAAVLVGALVALVTIPRAGIGGIVLAALAAFGGSLLPLAYVGFRAGRRVAALEAQLPDALDMMGAALQAGAGLAQAFAVIAREMMPPISDEFRRVLREIEMGLSSGEALSNLATRVGSEDVNLVVTTINVQTRVGGNLVHILGIIAHTIRERVRIRGEVKVLTAQQRLSSYVISAIPAGLVLIIYLINPTYIGGLFVPGIGQVMLATSVIMAVAGFLVLRKMTDIEV